MSDEPRKVTSQTPPATGGTDATGNASRRQRGTRSKLDKLEDRLNEMVGAAAMMQAGAGAVTGDARHIAGGQVTGELGPTVVAAWVALAKENDAVANILFRMVEGGAWGQVIVATAGFAYTQAQVYGALPPSMPNPWFRGPIVPPSPEVANHEPDNGEVIVGREPPRSGVGAEDPAHNEAEAQRRAVEQRRRERGS